MSRRSILLATTFYVAIGSFATVGPASAHGFGPGGLSGGQGGPAPSSFRSPGSSGFSNVGRTPMQSMGNSVGGTKLDHVPSIATSAVQGNISGPRLEPNRIPAVTNATIPYSPPPPVRQLPQAPTSSGIVARQPNAAGIVNAPFASRLSAAGIVSAPGTARIPGNPVKGIEPDGSARLKDISAGEGGAKLQKPGSNPEVPNVAGDPKVPGHGPDHGPDSSKTDGPTINLPGTMGQKGPREVPGVDTGKGGAGNLNLPGSVDRHGPDDAEKALAKSEADAQQILDTANRGGPNSLNTPTSPGGGIAVSDDTSGKKPSSGGGGSKPSGGGTSGSGASGGSKPTGTANTVFVGPGLYGSSGTSPTKDGGTKTVVTGQEGNVTYQIVTIKDKNGKTLSTTYSEKGKDGKVTTTSSGEEMPEKKNNTTPNDEDSSTIGGLNPSSGAGKTGNGGGTDNNGTETSVQATQLANGTSLGSKGNGDGTGSHGDNNATGIGAMAGGTSMARKDYGDGGGSDNRDGGTSLGAPKVGPAGGGAHAAATAAAAH